MTLSYVLKKCALLILSLFLVASATFFLMHLIPGDPFTQEQAIPEEVLKALHKHYHLDQPLIVQYGNFLKNLAHFDLGVSLKYPDRTVNEIIREGFPISFTLGIESLIISVVLGIALGAFAGFYHMKWQDNLALTIAILGISIPSFILGTILQYFFSLQLDWFPIARWGTFSSTVLPVLTLAAFPLAFIARLTRNRVIEVLQQDYVLQARAKGLGTFYIFWHHIARNALPPVLAYLGPLAAAVFTGSFVVEKIFGIPGLGQWVVASISNRDYPVIMGLTLFYSFILMTCVYIVEAVCVWMDPRIESREGLYYGQ